MDPLLYFAFRPRYRLNGDAVYLNPFAPWTVEDLYPDLDLDDDLEPAGFDELPYDRAAKEWLYSLYESDWPLLFLIERCCDQGELMDLSFRETRLATFPIQSAVACERAIAAAPLEFREDLFRVVSQAVRIERARRRGSADTYPSD